MSETVGRTFSDLWALFGVATHRDVGFRRFQEQWFLKRFNLTREELKELLKGKTVIEVGTGSGAFLHILSDAKKAYGLDISEVGLNIARKAHKGKDNICLVKADLMRFNGKFDIVIADQVLHHLPNTFKALKKTVSLVKPNGDIFFYVYRRKGFMREFFDHFFRAVTTRLPSIICLQFSKLMCALGRFLTWLSLPLQRTVYWNIMKCFWNDGFLYENNLRVNFDWYSPSIAHRHTLEEVLEWIKYLKLNIQSLNVGKSGISVRAIVSTV